MRRGIRGGKFMMPGVHRVTKGGKVYKWHRKTRTPLPANIPEDHPNFIAAWNAAEGGKPVRTRQPQGSVARGCEGYLASTDYKALSEGYRPVIRRHVEAIKAQAERAHPTPMLRDLTPQSVRADLLPLTPSVAKSRLSAWRKLAQHWEPSLGHDVTAGVKRKKIPKTDGYTPWTRDDVKAFRKHWPTGTPQRMAFEVLQWTGCRISDAVKIGPQMIGRDGLLTFKQQKTGVWVHVPWNCTAHGLEGQRTDLLSMTAGWTHLVYMLTEYGKARSSKAASAWFSGAATDAGLPHLSAHGLRKYRMNEMAEAAVPLLAMQSWVGHITLEEVQEYTAKANRRNVHLVNPSSEFTK